MHNFKCETTGYKLHDIFSFNCHVQGWEEKQIPLSLNLRMKIRRKHHFVLKNNILYWCLGFDWILLSIMPKKKTSVHDHGISVSHSFSNRKGMFNLSIFVEFKSLL